MKAASPILVGLFAPFVALTGPAPDAEPALVDGTDPAYILQLVRGFGSAELSKDDEGHPTISGRIEGIRYGAEFYGCTNGHDCNELLLSTGWSDVNVSLERLNAWNRDQRYGKAYLDEDLDPWLEVNVNLAHGVSSRNLDDTLDWWRVTMLAFKEQVVDQAPDKVTFGELTMAGLSAPHAASN